MRELEHLLPTLEPPAGGLARLRLHIHDRAVRTPWYRALAWAAPLAACLAVAAIWLPPWLARRQRTAALVNAVRQQLAVQAPVQGIEVQDGAAVELPSGQANVRIYLVQSFRRSAADASEQRTNERRQR